MDSNPMSTITPNRSPAPSVGAGEGELLCFGEFKLDVDGLELFRQGEAVQLQLQPAKVLELLARSSGELVLRQTIQRHVWGEDHHVDYEQGLNYCIKRIRRALGDSSAEPRFVETVPRRGYRFLAPVTLRDRPAPSGVEVNPPPPGPFRKRPWRTGAAAAALIAALAAFLSVAAGSLLHPPAEEHPRLAVLPIETSGEGGSDEAAAQVTMALLEDLIRSSRGELAIVSYRSTRHLDGSSLSPREMGRLLGADLLVAGLLVEEGEQSELLVELLRARDGEVLWQGSYPANFLGAGPDLRPRLAADAIVEHLGLTPVRAEHRQARLSAETFKTYAEGRRLLRERPGAARDQARELFGRVLLEAPDFAPAHLAWAAANLGWGPDRPARLVAAEAAVREALRLDPGFPEAWIQLGSIRLLEHADREGALEAIARALELSPRDARALHYEALLLSSLGRHEEAVAGAKLAVEMDPLTAVVWEDRGWIFYWARRYREALATAEQALRIREDSLSARHCLLYSALALGERETALAQAREIEARSGRAVPASLEEFWRSTVERFEEGPPDAESSLTWAAALVQLDRREDALRALRLACGRDRSWPRLYFGVDARLDPLREDPRFQDAANCSGQGSG